MKAKEQTPADGPSASFSEAAHRPIGVLLIEDNVGFSYFVRDALVRKMDGRFELDQAGDLAQGLKLLETTTPDVLLLDLGLPDSSGFPTFARVHEHAPQIPIIVLTVLDDDEVTMRAVRNGAQDYLLKDGLDKDLLVRSIRYAVERARAQAAVRKLSGRLLQLQDEERRRIAQALHDTTAQNLAALSMNLSMLGRQAPDLTPEAKALLDESLAFAEKCCTELRTTAYLLHPPLLDQVGLAGAVRDYADGFAERSGIRVDLGLPKALERLPEEVETALFRIMQESLTNVHRHSGSPTASIVIDRNPNEVTLVVKDSGRGMPNNHQVSPNGSVSGLGVGIAGMRERVRQLGGRMEIDSSGKGTTVSAVLPLGGESP